MQRYFRATDAVYEQVRLTLDAAWGHPRGGTITCIEPAATSPRDQQGHIVLAVEQAFAEYPAAAAMLEFMLGTGQATEITEAEYRAAVQQEPA